MIFEEYWTVVPYPDQYLSRRPVFGREGDVGIFSTPQSVKRIFHQVQKDLSHEVRIGKNLQVFRLNANVDRDFGKFGSVLLRITARWINSFSLINSVQAEEYG